MNRGNFIKSLALIIAAPKVLSQIEVTKKPVIRNKKDYWFKITEEMENDIDYMKYAVSDNGFIFKNATKAGIDMNKEFDLKVGFEKDDFVRNLKTGVISQYV